MAAVATGGRARRQGAAKPSRACTQYRIVFEKGGGVVASRFVCHCLRVTEITSLRFSYFCVEHEKGRRRSCSARALSGARVRRWRTRAPRGCPGDPRWRRARWDGRRRRWCPASAGLDEDGRDESEQISAREGVSEGRRRVARPSPRTRTRTRGMRHPCARS